MNHFPKNSIQHLAKDLLRLFDIDTIVPNRIALKVPKKTGLDDPARIHLDLLVPSPPLCVVVAPESPKIKFAYYRGNGYRIFHIAQHKDLLQFFRFLQQFVKGGKEIVLPPEMERRILRLSTHRPTQARKTYVKHYKKSRKELRRHQQRRSEDQKAETRANLQRLFSRGEVDEAYFRDRLEKLHSADPKEPTREQRRGEEASALQHYAEHYEEYTSTI